MTGVNLSAGGEAFTEVSAGCNDGAAGVAVDCVGAETVVTAGVDGAGVATTGAGAATVGVAGFSSGCLMPEASWAPSEMTRASVRRSAQ